MLDRTHRRHVLSGTVLTLALLALGWSPPAAAQWEPEHLDPGFPENGFSIPTSGYGGPGGKVGESESWRLGYYGFGTGAWPPPTWLPHGGNDQYLHISESKNLPLHEFRVHDEQGRPLAGVTVEFQQAGYRTPGIRGVTDADGAFLVTVRKPARSHRVRFRAPGRQEVVMEMSGGRLRSARHEIELTAGSELAPPAVVAYVPGQRTPPPPDVDRSYRRGLKALERDRFELAARELRLAVERWPLPSPSREGGVAAGYRPYEALAEALAELGEEELAASWRARGEAVESSGS
jgi:hypothetical protein